MPESADHQCDPPTDDPGETPLLDDLRVVLSRRAAADTGSPDRPDHLEGMRVGQYVIGERLGEGGMAQVYRATDNLSQREVAFKVLKSQYRADHRLCARFEREARSMARIQHAHVVRIFGFPRGADIRAIAMELLPGGSLRNQLSRQSPDEPRIPIREAVHLITQAARGIGAAHEMGIVHRDVKPSNLLLDSGGKVKVADFGAILVLEQTTWLTGVGQQIGTPGYMSPEQCQGKRVTAASDVYSLGTTLFELVTGQRPFVVEDASPFAMMLKHLSEPAPDPRTLRADVPDWLAGVILKCLEKKPADRYATGAELAEVLQAGPAAKPLPDHEDLKPSARTVNVGAIRQQLQELPQRAIVGWACRCARRVQGLNPDPRVERALAMAEAAAGAPEGGGSPHPLSHALSRVRALRVASLKAAYADDRTPASADATEAARAAAAAAAAAAARCIDDAAADAAFAARSAIAALQLADRPIQPFWHAARADYRKLLEAQLGPAGTVGQPVPPSFFNDTRLT